MNSLRWLLLPLAVYAGLITLALVSTLPDVQSALAATVADLGAKATGPGRYQAAETYLASRAFPGIPDFPWGRRFLALELLVVGLLSVRVGQGWLAAERNLAGVLWGLTGLIMVVAAVETGTDLLDNIDALKGTAAGLVQSTRYLAGVALVVFLVFAVATTRSWMVRICLTLAAGAVLDGMLFDAGGPGGSWAALSPFHRLGSLVFGLAFDLQHSALDGQGWLMLGDLLLEGTSYQLLMFANAAVGLVGLGAWAQLEEMGRTSRERRI